MMLMVVIHKCRPTITIRRRLFRVDIHVVMACRNLEKAEEALNQITSEDNAASLEIIRLDLSDLASIKVFVSEFSKKHQSLDILCNNAGVMMTPYQKTADGFELQLGTNHFGHFALTGLLICMITDFFDRQPESSPGYFIRRITILESTKKR